MTTLEGTFSTHTLRNDALRALFFLPINVDNLWIQTGITLRKTRLTTLAQTWVKGVRNSPLFKNRKLFYISSTPVHIDIHSAYGYKNHASRPQNDIFHTIHTPNNKSSILYKEI